MFVSRRDFLKTSSALAGITLIGVDLPLIAQAAERARAGAVTGAGARMIPSTCAQCVNFCGISVKVENGVVRAVYPDKARAPYYNWGICPKGVASVFNTYNPYRLKAPMKRTNPIKGIDEDPKWVEIGWDEAFDTIAGRLKKIKADNPAKLIWQHGHGKYLIGDQFPKAFAAAFGTPNLVHRTTTCEAARHVADEITWGYHGFLPDLDNCNLFLNMGANYFEAEQWAKWLDHATTDAKERGMKVVVVDPRMSSCAAKADEWIPIRPGKDVVMLLAMGRVLIESGLIDEPFLTTYTNAPDLVGADGAVIRDKDGKPLVWDAQTKSARPFTAGVVPTLKGAFTVDGRPARTAFQVLVDSLADVTLAYAEEATGVPAAAIERLAKEFGRQARIGATVVVEGHTLRYRPVAIHTFRGFAAKEFGVQNWRAGLVVQMLVGNIDAVGGIRLEHVYGNPKYMQASKAEYPPKRVDLQQSVFFPHSTHNVCQQVALTLLDPKAYGLGYEPEMQIFYATNRPFSTSEALKQFEALKKTYNVVIDIVFSDITAMADIVLPDLTDLEAWHYSPTRGSVTTSVSAAIRQPVANAFGLAQDAYTILWELARRLGLRDSYIENLNKQWGLKKVKFEPGRDYTAQQAVEVIWTDKTGKDFAYALEHGFVGKKKNAEQVYLDGVEAKFKGPDKPKMYLYADGLVGTLANVKKVAKEHDIAAIDPAKYELALSPLPRKEHGFPTPHREARDYPFYLITYKRTYRNQSGYMAFNPILGALGAKDTTDATDENFVLINRTAAAKMEIGNGDAVVIETRIGKVQGKAKVTEGIRPDTVAVSYHYGHRTAGYPDYARKGTWINQVLELHPDLVSGMNSFNDTKCKVSKA